MTATTNAAGSTTGALGAGTRDGRCESCRQAPAQLLLHLGGAAPFAVCGGCALMAAAAEATADASADGLHEGDASAAAVPAPGGPRRGGVAPRFRDQSVPWDFEGTVRIPQSWWETAWPVVGSGVPCVVALVTYGVTGSPIGLMLGGIVTGVAALVLDSRRSR